MIKRNSAASRYGHARCFHPFRPPRRICPGGKATRTLVISVIKNRISLKIVAEARPRMIRRQIAERFRFRGKRWAEGTRMFIAKARYRRRIDAIIRTLRARSISQYILCGAFKIPPAATLYHQWTTASALYTIYSVACTCSVLSKSREEKQRRAERRCSSWPHRNIWRHPICIFGTATRHFQFSTCSLVFSSV